ncbi:MAG TPA: hypothetical protein VKY92_26555, partial [Verrucomicrobiae bacterium]|nr:hypothetical protein [Verrucomicrobiae bacterium]
HQPYAQVNLHSIALLLEIARDFGHLATGRGINPEPPAHHATFAADLARIYGDKPSQPCST